MSRIPPVKYEIRLLQAGKETDRLTVNSHDEQVALSMLRRAVEYFATESVKITVELLCNGCSFASVSSEASSYSQKREEDWGFCGQCERDRPVRQLKSKNVRGRPLVMCEECWEKTYTEHFPTGGRRSKSESITHKLYCPTCGKGVNKHAKNELVPRECYRCRHGGRGPGDPISPEERAADKRAVRAEHIPAHQTPDCWTNREVVAPPVGRHLSLINPNRDLCVDLKMVRDMFYLRRGRPKQTGSLRRGVKR